MGWKFGRMENVATAAFRTASLALVAFSLSPQAQAQDVLLPGEVMRFDAPEIARNVTSDCPAGSPVPSLCNAAGNVAENEARVFVVQIGLSENIGSATSSLAKSFRVDDGEGADSVVDARITGSVAWRGTLFAAIPNQAGPVTLPPVGTAIGAFIRAALVDTNGTPGDLSDDFQVGNDAVADFDCAPDTELGGEIASVGVSALVGRCEFSGGETFSFGAKVITGRTYELQLDAICKVTVGGLVPGFAAGCTFNPSSLAFDEFDTGNPDVDGILDAILPTIDNGFVEWDYFTVTVGEDIAGQIETLRGGVREMLRLLHTPNGRRSFSSPGDADGFEDACGDGNCDWNE